jgi:stearoyl-CoA desaturase (delta-9 desaturase)
MDPYSLLAAKVFLYVMIGWVSIGTYVSVVLHRGLSHRALVLPQWFIHLVTMWSASFVIYVNPKVWVAEHRLHHAHSDTDQDPDKKPGWNLWQFTWWSITNPAGPHDEHVARLVREPALNTWVMRLYSDPKFGLFSQVVTGMLLPFWIFGGLWQGAIGWLGLRLGGVLVKMIQGYFSHSPLYGYRNFDTDDVSNNLNGWFATWVSAGESLQNNHHARPQSPTHAFKAGERDFGMFLVRFWQMLGLVTIPEKNTVTPVAEVAPA